MAGDKWEGRQLFDDKLMVQADYMYDGVKGGVAWKGKLSRYFITKVPALGDVLKWSGKHGKDDVTEDAFDTVIGHVMDKPKQDAVNAAIWGFLAGCLSGPADTHFKKADDCVAGVLGHLILTMLLGPLEDVSESWHRGDEVAA